MKTFVLENLLDIEINGTNQQIKNHKYLLHIIELYTIGNAREILNQNSTERKYQSP